MSENTTPAADDDDRSEVQEERREEAQRRNPDLHGEALEAAEGNPDGTGRTLG